MAEHTPTDREPILIHQTRCVRVRNRHASCARCIDACPASCISCSGNVLSIDRTSCLDCGACAAACPTGALELGGGKQGELLRACVDAVRSNAGSVRIACPAVHGESAVSTGCLRRIDESVLATLAACGTRSVILAHGDCARCARGRSRAGSSGGTGSLVDATVASAKSILARWGSSISIEIEAHAATARVDSKPAETGLPCPPEQPPSRPIRLAKVNPSTRQLVRHVPDKRKRLLKALATMAQKRRPDSGPFESDLWASPSIDAKACTGCRACTIFCPTGALSASTDPSGHMTVDRVVGLCVGCSCCEDVCPTGALGLGREVDVDDILSGQASSQVVEGPEHPNGQPDSIYWRMKELTQATNLYLR